MRYKRIFVLAMAAVMVLAIAASGVEPEHNRYHQHLEAAEKAPCTDHDESVFCTHLPLMEITTDGPVPEPYVTVSGVAVMQDGHRIRNSEMVASSVRYFDSETKNNHLTDQPAVEERALLRIRGASSRRFDKKNYLMKFTEDDMLTSLNVSLSGMAADNSWVLHGPFLDKSLIRNYLCYNLAGEFMDYSPNVRFCELFLNGEYMGLYLLVEKIGFNPRGRIELTETDPDLSVTSYIIQVDRGTEDPLRSLETFGSYSYLANKVNEANEADRNFRMEIIYPNQTLTQRQHDYIETDFSRFEKALFSYDYNDPKKGYRQYIDVQSFVDFFLLTEFTLNADAPGLSTFLYKDVGGKLKMCAWDFNSAFDYYQYSYITPETFLLKDNSWFEFLLKDEEFVDQVVKRYHDLRKRFFNEEYLFQYIDDTVAYLGPAVDRNFEKWGYSFQSIYNGISYDYLKPTSRNVRSFDEAIQQIKDIITLRLESIDGDLDLLYSLCHISTNKRYNYVAEAGGT